MLLLMGTHEEDKEVNKDGVVNQDRLVNVGESEEWLKWLNSQDCLSQVVTQKTPDSKKDGKVGDQIVDADVLGPQQDKVQLLGPDLNRDKGVGPMQDGDSSIDEQFEIRRCLDEISAYFSKKLKRKRLKRWRHVCEIESDEDGSKKSSSSSSHSELLKCTKGWSSDDEVHTDKNEGMSQNDENGPEKEETHNDEGYNDEAPEKEVEEEGNDNEVVEEVVVEDDENEETDVDEELSDSESEKSCDTEFHESDNEIEEGDDDINIEYVVADMGGGGARSQYG